MKQKFNTSWKSSKQPRKQRKYLANAPLHLKKKAVSANLSKELRTKHNARSISLRKGDVVSVMRGKFKGKQGKVLEVILKFGKVVIEGIQVKKADGSKVNTKLQPSNLKIIELNLDDKRRLKTSVKETKPLNTSSQEKTKGQEEIKPEKK